MSTISVRWAPNTARDLNEEAHCWEDVCVEGDPGDEETILLYTEGNVLVAKFSQHDVAVLLVD